MNSQISEILNALTIPDMANLVMEFIPTHAQFEVGSEYEKKLNHYSKLKMRVLERRHTHKYRVNITVRYWIWEQNEGWTDMGTRKMRVDRRDNKKPMNEVFEYRGTAIEAV